MLLVAIESLEGIDGHELAVRSHEGEALLPNPGCDRLVVALPSADERRAEIEMPGAACGWRGDDAGEKILQRPRRERPNRTVGVRVMLNPEPGVEQPEVLCDLGDRGDGGLAGTAGDALLDRDGGRDPGEPIHRGSRQLFHELARVGRHRLHETPLALGKHDIEGQRRLARTGHAGDNGQLPVRNREGEILEIVLPRALDRQLGRHCRLPRDVELFTFGAVGPGRLGRHQLQTPSSPLRTLPAQCRAEKGRGFSFRGGDDFGRTLRHDPASAGAGSRTDLD